MGMEWWDGTAIVHDHPDAGVQPVQPRLAGRVLLPCWAWRRTGGVLLEIAYPVLIWVAQAPAARARLRRADAPGYRPVPGAHRIRPRDGRGQPGLRLRPLAPRRDVGRLQLRRPAMAWRPIPKGSVRRAAALLSCWPSSRAAASARSCARRDRPARNPLVDRPRWSRIELAIGVTVGRPPCRWVAAVEIAAALP